MRYSRVHWATRPWDVLTLSLVLIPLLTGGAWIKRPGFQLEITELGVPVLVIAALTLILRKWIDPENSAVILTLKRLWGHWKGWGARGVVWGSLVFGAVLSLASMRRHWAMGSNAADLGIFQGALWNLTHGYGLMSPVKGGILLFRDHLSPILFVIAPLFALFPKAETLLIVQGVGIALGAIPLFYLSLQYARPALQERASPIAAVALAAPILYWLYLPTRNGNAFDFHPETLMLPIGLWFIAAAQSARARNRWLAVIPFALLLAGKESSGALLVGLGAAWALGAAPEATRASCRKLGLALIPFAFTWFWWETRWVPEHFFGQRYAYEGAYAGFDPGFAGILLSPFRHPLLLLERLFGLARLKFLFWTLGGLAFLPLLGWRAAIGAVPCYLMLFLTSGDHRLSLFYYYATEPSIALFWALPIGWLAAERINWSKVHWSNPAWFTAWICFWALALSGRSEMYRIRKYAPDEHALWLAREFVPCVEHSVPLAATGSLLPHLAERHWAVALPVLDGEGGGNIGCVVSDSQIDPWPLSQESAHDLPRSLLSLGYQQVYQCGSVQVLSRNTRCMECTPTCLRP